MGKNTNNLDWPNLNRYKNENIKLGDPVATEKRIVFMGDSITEGWKTVCPDFFANNSYVNRGIGGQTTPQILLRFRADVIELKPTVVVILAGTNDIAGNTGPATHEMILGNIISMTELAIANAIKPILCSVLPSIDYNWKPGLYPAEKIERLNEMIQKYASENDIIYVDYFSAMVDEQKGMKIAFSKDGVHPNKVGYETMIPILEKTIEKILIFT